MCNSLNLMRMSIYIGFTIFGSFSYAEQHENSVKQICIEAVRENLEILGLDEKASANKCECVKSKRNGKLPATAFDWNKTGFNSASLTLVECSKSEVLTFYSQATINSAKDRLQKNGLNDEQIKRVGSCVAEGAYLEMRRAATATGQPDALNKSKFRQMYALCERAAN